MRKRVLNRTRGNAPLGSCRNRWGRLAVGLHQSFVIAVACTFGAACRGALLPAYRASDQSTPALL